MKILIIRFSSIGDIVLTTPVIRVLKTQLDNAEIHYVTKSRFAGLLKENPYVDKLHLLGDSLNALITELRKEQFDQVIDLHNNLRTRIIKMRLGVKAHSFNKLNWEKWLMVNFKINKLPSIHIVDRYLQTTAHLGIKNDSLGLDYFIPESDEVPLEWIPVTHQMGYVTYAIGGQHATKKLPVKRMIELCDKINRPIILLGGKEDFAEGEQVRLFFERNEAEAEMEAGLTDVLNKRTIIYNACGKYNLNQSASIVKRSTYVFTHDTGVMHIAAALKKEVFSIWGNTIPLFGMYPYRTKFTILENNKLDCRPCSKIGYKKCPKGHFNCMQKIIFDFYLPE
ncbi:MAG TPA: glycosyl transferase [Cytophagales bacterium]|nr:glycosyl transferase [Cytophagales bacterium]